MADTEIIEKNLAEQKKKIVFEHRLHVQLETFVSKKK